MKSFKTLAVDHICNINIQREDATICELKIDDSLTLSGLYYIKNDTDKVVVFFNGATTSPLDGKKIYSRWSWGYNTGTSFISFDDPIVSCTRLTNLGWYIGTKDTDIQDIINKILLHVCDKFNIPLNRVVFYGSSGGGFAAIMAAIKLRGSTAIALNPQTNILKYNKKPHETVLNNFFSINNAIHESVLTYLDRFSILEAIKRTSYLPNVIYIQNTQDTFHLNNHYIPFHDLYVKMTRDVGNYKNKLHVRLFNHEDGHSSISNQSEFLNEVSFALSNFTETETTHISTRNQENKLNLSDNTLWFDIDDAAYNSEIKFSILLSNLCPDNDKKPAILLFECHELATIKLKEAGLWYSDSLQCPYKYIDNFNEDGFFSLTIKNSISIKKVGIRRWQSINQPVLEHFNIKYDRDWQVKL
ncbi:hypothetical protein [Aeromonas salmonicida]|uniref:hypothetical protein n=1 Tax=Aeromonas salmonicida TaxID=645 RepID=UPI00232DB9D5|nr:hypothetical protein [Aeromonas salmonicida]WCH21323.1 hypothetical protein ONZ54_14355 [Aeromonas salmonicida]